MIREMTYSSIRSGTYEPIKVALGGTDRHHTTLRIKLTAGAIAGVLHAQIAEITYFPILHYSYIHSACSVYNGHLEVDLCILYVLKRAQLRLIQKILSVSKLSWDFSLHVLVFGLIVLYDMHRTCTCLLPKLIKAANKAAYPWRNSWCWLAFWS